MSFAIGSLLQVVYSNVGDYRKGADMRRSYLKVIVFVIVLVLVGVACELSAPADPTATVEIALPQEEPPIQEPVEPEPTDPPPLPTATEEPMAEPTEEPTEEPADDVQDEPGLEEELANLTDLYIKKLKNARSSVEQSDVAEIVSQIMDSFGYGNQDKLSVLQSVKQSIVR